MIKRPRLHRVLREILCSIVRLLVGAYSAGIAPSQSTPTLYFANHTSHLDTLTLLAALRLRARARTRPVAARDYWGKTPLRAWIAEKVLNVVFVDRVRTEGEDPLAAVNEALQDGWSLIFFPEGTRREQALPGEFKSGLYHLAQRHPGIRLIPVYLENLHRILPKGSAFPVPLINRVHFGAELRRIEEESKQGFLSRAHQAVCNLCPRL